MLLLLYTRPWLRREEGQFEIIVQGAPWNGFEGLSGNLRNSPAHCFVLQRSVSRQHRFFFFARFPLLPIYDTRLPSNPPPPLPPLVVFSVNDERRPTPAFRSCCSGCSASRSGCSWSSLPGASSSRATRRSSLPPSSRARLRLGESFFDFLRPKWQRYVATYLPAFS